MLVNEVVIEVDDEVVVDHDQVLLPAELRINKLSHVETFETVSEERQHVRIMELHRESHEQNRQDRVHSLSIILSLTRVNGSGGIGHVGRVQRYVLPVSLDIKLREIHVLRRMVDNPSKQKQTTPVLIMSDFSRYDINRLVVRLNIFRSL